jgi:hypothetical protein
LVEGAIQSQCKPNNDCQRDSSGIKRPGLELQQEERVDPRQLSESQPVPASLEAQVRHVLAILAAILRGSRLLLLHSASGQRLDELVGQRTIIRSSCVVGEWIKVMN